MHPPRSWRVTFSQSSTVTNWSSSGAGASVAGQVSANRKKFRGTLERAESGGWQIVWRDEPAVKPGQKVSKKRVPAPLQALGFTLDELRDARLAPIVDFKGRAGKAGQGAA